MFQVCLDPSMVGRQEELEWYSMLQESLMGLLEGKE
jgi:hypothetical protein